MIVIIKSLYENELEKISGGVTGGLRGPQAALIISFIPIEDFPGGGQILSLQNFGPSPSFSLPL